MTGPAGSPEARRNRSFCRSSCRITAIGRRGRGRVVGLVLASPFLHFPQPSPAGAGASAPLDVLEERGKAQTHAQ